MYTVYLYMENKILPPRGNNYIILLNIRIMNLSQNVWYQEKRNNGNVTV